jgi:hypothetical protein
MNAPLSMHSEMMAIQSALSLSSGAQASQKSARSAKWLQKPCFKLSSVSKRKARLQGLKAYVEAVCIESAAEGYNVKQLGGKLSLQKSCFEAHPSQPGQGRAQLWHRGGGQGESYRCGGNEEEWRESPIEK